MLSLLKNVYITYVFIVLIAMIIFRNFIINIDILDYNIEWFVVNYFRCFKKSLIKVMISYF
jgi:hypothetical protein